jgi:hypothetical protein
MNRVWWKLRRNLTPAIVRTLDPDEVADKYYETSEKKKMNKTEYDGRHRTRNHCRPEAIIMCSCIQMLLASEYSMQVRSHNPNPLVHISCRRHQGVDQLKKLDVFKNEIIGGEPFHCSITIKRNDPEKLSIGLFGNGRKP